MLTGNELGDMSGFGDWQHVANLEKLYLANCEISDVRPLLDRPLPVLAKLCLNGNELGAGAATAIAKAAAKLPSLKRLELAETGVDLSGVKALMGAFKDLRLDVRNTKVKTADVATFGGRPCPCVARGGLLRSLGASPTRCHDPERFRRDGHRLIDALADQLAAWRLGEGLALPWQAPAGANARCGASMATAGTAAPAPTWSPT